MIEILSQLSHCIYRLNLSRPCNFYTIILFNIYRQFYVGNHKCKEWGKRERDRQRERGYLLDFKFCLTKHHYEQ